MDKQALIKALNLLLLSKLCLFYKKNGGKPLKSHEIAIHISIFVMCRGVTCDITRPRPSQGLVTPMYWYNLVFASHIMGTLEEKRLSGTSRLSKHFKECDIYFYLTTAGGSCYRNWRTQWPNSEEEIWEMSHVPPDSKELSNPSSSNTSHGTKSWLYVKILTPSLFHSGVMDLLFIIFPLFLVSPSITTLIITNLFPFYSGPSAY